MTIEYDEKGKFYTDVVTKVSVHSLIQTTTHLVRGDLHVRQGGRLKDEIEGSEIFIAVTNAEISDKEGKVIHHAPFLAIQKDQIVWIMPVDEEGNKGTNG